MEKPPKYGLAGMLLAAGLSIFSGGCAEMTDSDLLALALRCYGLNAKTSKQAQSAGVLSDYASQSGRRQHEINAAREVGEGWKQVPTVVYERDKGRISYFDGKNIWLVQKVNSKGQFIYDNGKIVPEGVRVVE